MKSPPLYSSRKRLLLSLFLVMVAVIGAVAVSANRISRHEAEEIFSARLATSARVLEALLAKQLETATISNPFVISLPEELSKATDGPHRPFGHPYENKLAFQVWSEGRLLARSETAPAAMLGPLVAGFHDQKIGDFEWHVFVLQSGNVWLMTAERDDVREELAREIGLSVISPLLIGGVLLLLLVNWLALRALEPVRELAAAIRQRDPSSLEPMTIKNPPSELQPVIEELNSLLSRLHETFSREKRFIDAAAHELRTPMTAVQLHVQNALYANSPQERDESIQEALASLKRAERLADQLLALSRISANAQPVAFEKFSLSGAFAEAISGLDPIFEQKNQTISTSYASHDEIYGHRENIIRLITNLLINASNYGASPGVIGVKTLAQQGGLALLVENEGDAIRDEEKEKIFTPYYRILGSKPSGSGLGLAIVEEISRQHGASLSLEDRPAGGARFIVNFQQKSSASLSA